MLNKRRMKPSLLQTLCNWQTGKLKDVWISKNVFWLLYTIAIVCQGKHTFLVS